MMFAKGVRWHVMNPKKDRGAGVGLELATAVWVNSDLNKAVGYFGITCRVLKVFPWTRKESNGPLTFVNNLHRLQWVPVYIHISLLYTILRPPCIHRIILELHECWKPCSKIPSKMNIQHVHRIFWLLHDSLKKHACSAKTEETMWSAWKAYSTTHSADSAIEPFSWMLGCQQGRRGRFISGPFLIFLNTFFLGQFDPRVCWTNSTLLQLLASYMWNILTSCTKSWCPFIPSNFYKNSKQ